MEAAAPRADGTGVSLPEAHRAPMGGRSRASRGGCGTRGGQRGRSRSAKGRARYRAPCSQGFDREASALEKGQEVRRIMGRSEEHTSELQSQSNLVCRLLLEKKKNQA